MAVLWLCLPSPAALGDAGGGVWEFCVLAEVMQRANFWAFLVTGSVHGVFRRRERRSKEEAMCPD
jgi:hypothetical protein